MTIPLDKLPDWPFLMPIEAVCLAVGGVSATTLRKYVEKDEFPKPVQTLGRKMWKRDEIRDWVARQGDDAVQSPRPKKRLGEKAGDRAG
jgi:predicted DNA-binding transcriptional regulator AlpA